MDIQLSWDLFVLVFFIVIVAYSFIIGRDNTLKVILGTYVAAIAADASGNLFGIYFGDSTFFSKILSMVSIGNAEEVVILVKVLIFVGLVILYSVKGAFAVKTIDDRSSIIRLVLMGLYALMSASLIVSVILVFVSGISLVGSGNAESAQAALRSLSERSEMITFLLNNAYFLFAIPALSFLIHSFYSKD